MKRLNGTDRASTYKIECARYSYVILERKWIALRTRMLGLKSSEHVNEEVALELLSDAWQVVDFAARFQNVLGTIRGLRRKDGRYLALLKTSHSLREVRNFIQHVDQETHKITAETYPILGALAWAMPDASGSFTTWLGTLPPKTTFHSVAFETAKGRYVDDVLLGVGNHTVKLNEVVSSCAGASSLLDEWLAWSAPKRRPPA